MGAFTHHRKRRHEPHLSTGVPIPRLAPAGVCLATYAIRLSRAGQDDLGPGLLTAGPAEAVRGSPEGETYARRARRWAFVNQGLYAMLSIVIYRKRYMLTT